MINKVMPIFGRRLPPSADTPLLDTYGGASVAYSLRYLSTAFTGNAVVKVRRSSDNAEQDFIPSEISDGTLTTWVGAGNDGFVTIWYDQSGNGVNAIQTDVLKQILIVIGGILQTDNGLPALQTNGLTACGFEHLGNTYLAFTHQSEATWSLVANVVAQATISRSTGSISPSGIGFFAATNGPLNSIAVNGATFAIRYRDAVGFNATYHYLWDYDLTESIVIEKSNFSYNDTMRSISESESTAPPSSSPTSSNNFSLIGIQDNRFYGAGKYQEYILWDTRYNTERDAIRENINEYYSIY